MGKEYLPEEPKQRGSEEQKVVDDLRFMRSVVEKSYRQLKPKTSNSIMWGLICMAIYIGIHFLIKNQLFDWIRPLQISLISFGVLCTIIQAHFLSKKFKQEGFFPQSLISILYGMLLIVVPVFFFDMIGLFEGMYCGSAFIYALTANTIIFIIGSFHSKLWLIGTIFILSGILMAFIIREYSFLILGVATGTGIILPALIVDLYFRKQEKENAKA
jgi:hypothetical protein